MLCNELSLEGLRSATWVPGWECSPQRSFEHAITPDRPSTAPLTTLMDDFLGQATRALQDGAAGPEAFDLFLLLLNSHFDHAESGAGYKKLHTFGMPNGTPFCEFSGEFRVIVSAATGA